MKKIEFNKRGLVIAIMIISFFQSAHSTELWVNGVEYTLYTGSLNAEVTDCLWNKQGEVTILSSVVSTYTYSVTSISSEAFMSCGYITGVVIPEGITEIGVRAFKYCSDLVSVSLPSTLTTFGAEAFRGCTDITEISIPEGITELPMYLFNTCTSLVTVYCYNADPPTVGDSALGAVPTERATLYVPIGSKVLYEVADGWKDFATIIEIDYTGVESVELVTTSPYFDGDNLVIGATSADIPVSIYDINGALIKSFKADSSLNRYAISPIKEGVYIVVIGSKSYKIKR